MYKSEFRGKQIRIEGNDYKQLLERFDVKNAKLADDGYFEICIPCALCERYEECEGCPFEQFGKSIDGKRRSDGCVTWMQETLDTDSFHLDSLFDIDSDTVFWTDREAEPKVTAIREALLKFKKVQEDAR